VAARPTLSLNAGVGGDPAPRTAAAQQCGMQGTQHLLAALRDRGRQQFLRRQRIQRLATSRVMLTNLQLRISARHRCVCIVCQGSAQSYRLHGCGRQGRPGGTLTSTAIERGRPARPPRPQRRCSGLRIRVHRHAERRRRFARRSGRCRHWQRRGRSRPGGHQVRLGRHARHGCGGRARGIPRGGRRGRHGRHRRQRSIGSAAGQPRRGSAGAG